LRKITKKWANLVYFLFLKGLQNLGKYFMPNFPIKVWMSNAFSQNLFILNAKKTQMRLFFGRRKYNINYFLHFLNWNIVYIVEKNIVLNQWKQWK